MSLKLLVNDKNLYDDFLEELDQRISSAQRTLEQVATVEEMYRAQGAIAALRNLKLLREKVNGQESF